MFVLVRCVGFNYFINLWIIQNSIYSFVNVFRTRHFSLIQVVTYAKLTKQLYWLKRIFLYYVTKLPKLIRNANANLKQTVAQSIKYWRSLGKITQWKLNSVILKGKRYVKHGSSFTILATVYRKSARRRLAKLQSIRIK